MGFDYGGNTNEPGWVLSGGDSLALWPDSFLTDNTPYAGLILFEDEAYVEIYHISERIQDRGICGQVPILILKRRSEKALFELFESHFKSVWNTRSGATGLSVRAAKAAAATDMEA